MRKLYLVVLCAAATLVACTAAEPKSEFKAVSTTQDVMESLVAHMAQEVWDSVKIEIDEKGARETRPQNKEEWQEVAYAARGLAEASTLLMYDGRVEDRGDWEKFVKELTDTSLVAAKAADDQDFDGLMEAGGNIYEVCTKCHEAYLEKVEKKRTGGTLDAPLTPPPGAPASTTPTTEKK
jgi:cytochrome c556